MIIKRNLHLKSLERFRVSEGRDLKKGLRLDRNEKVDDWPENFITKILANKPSGFFSMYPEIVPLYQKLAKHLKVNEKQILITSGIDGSIKNLFAVLTEPGDKVAVFSPTYLMYEIYSKIFKVEFYPLTYSENYKLKKDELDNFLSLNPTILFVPNPNMPIESSLNVSELRELAARCKEKNCFLVLDEAYYMLGADTGISLLNEFDNVIILRTFSKAFGVPSIRTGFTVSTEENMEIISKTRLAHEQNSVSITIAEYLLDNFHIVKKYCEQIKKSRDLTLSQIKNLGLEVRGNHGCYLLVTFKNEKIANNVVKFLKEKLIYVKGPYKNPWNNCIGISIGIQEKMKPFISALIEAKGSIF